MNISEQLPDPGDRPHFRPRRSRPFTIDDPAGFIYRLIDENQPTFDYFWVTILAAIVLTFANLTVTPGILILGAILCFNTTPWVGMGFALAGRSLTEFWRNLLSILVVLVITIIIGTTGAWISARFGSGATPTGLEFIKDYPFHWDLLLLQLIGTGLCAFFSVKKNTIARLGLIAVGFVHLQFAAAIGFSLYNHDWHRVTDLALFLLFCLLLTILVTLIIVHVIKLVRVEPYILGGVTFLLLITSVLIIPIRPPFQVVQPNLLITATSPAENTPLPTMPPIATRLPKPIQSLPTATRVMTISVTPSPIPRVMVVQAEGQRGARLRASAGLDGIVIDVLINGTSVTVLGPETQKDDYRWLNIRTKDGKIGWIVDSALIIPQEIMSTAIPPTVTRTN